MVWGFENGVSAPRETITDVHVHPLCENHRHYVTTLASHILEMYETRFQQAIASEATGLVQQALEMSAVSGRTVQGARKGFHRHLLARRSSSLLNLCQFPCNDPSSTQDDARKLFSEKLKTIPTRCFLDVFLDQFWNSASRALRLRAASFGIAGLLTMEKLNSIRDHLRDAIVKKYESRVIEQLRSISKTMDDMDFREESAEFAVRYMVFSKYIDPFLERAEKFPESVRSTHFDPLETKADLYAQGRISLAAAQPDVSLPCFDHHTKVRSG